MNTHDSCSLITGCSSGFGLETAVVFAQRGDDVIATMRDPARAGRLRQRTQSLPGNVAIERLDVTDQASIDAAVAATLERFDTNVFGAAAVTRAVLPQMRHRQRGRIIFMNAIGDVLTTAFLGAYCASKHALDCLAAVFDLELRPFGIRVSSVYPSAFHTASPTTCASRAAQARLTRSRLRRTRPP